MAFLWLQRHENVDILQGFGRRPRRIPNFDYNVYDEEEFRQRYRLTKDAFYELLDIIRPNLLPHNNRGRPIPVDLQLLLTLRFYATGSFQLACGDLCGISQSSASRIIKKVSTTIARLKNRYITFPEGVMLQQVKLDFWRIGRIPGVVGAIDCTHVQIPCPGGANGELFRNRKGYFSINVQGVCGPNLEIQNIVARWPGSVHDSRIFDNSRLCAQFEHGQINGLLLGDSGYACRPYLLTPLLAPRTHPERRYNVAHIRTRNTVERTFGVLKRMFPCLKMSLRTKLSTTLTIIVATAVLYNFVRGREDPIPDEEESENDDEDDDEALHHPVMGLGNATRHAMIQQHFTD